MTSIASLCRRVRESRESYQIRMWDYLKEKNESALDLQSLMELVSKTLGTGWHWNRYDDRIVVQKVDQHEEWAPVWIFLGPFSLPSSAECLLWLQNGLRASEAMLQCKVQRKNEVIDSCVSLFQGEEILLKVHPQKNPQVLVDRIVSNAFSQTRHLKGSGRVEISLDFRVDCSEGLWLYGSYITTQRPPWGYSPLGTGWKEKELIYFCQNHLSVKACWREWDIRQPLAWYIY